jgi:SAM-dependent methyltransferase
MSVLDLGKQPLANSYHKKGEMLPSYPLALNVCSNCFHAQQAVAVRPDLMFKQYTYVSGTSQTLRDYFDWFAKEVGRRYGRASKASPKKVLDIACNDGTQLTSFMKEGWQAFGVDPAENLIERSRRTGATVVCDYWNKKSAASFGTTFDILLAQNVFAHVARPLEFLEASKEVMEPHSKLLIQTSQAEMIARGEFDTIYHEHISFFSANSMQTLARRAGFMLEDIFITPVHGGSYVFVLGFDANEEKAQARLEYERQEGRYDLTFFKKFAEAAKKSVGELRDKLEDYTTEGRTIVGFGAAAKGNTLLNFAKLPLEYIVDENPLKHGLYTPGMDVLIVPPERLREERRPLAIVVLAWNFLDEIYKKVKAVRPEAEDVFVTYFPSVKVRK